VYNEIECTFRWWSVNMMAIAKVTSKFQLTIPSEIRDALNLEGGDRIVFRVNDDGEVTIRVLKSVSVDDLAGALGQSASHPLEYIPFEKARSMVQDEMAERFVDEVHTSTSQADNEDERFER
jgi:antitoxin PrlF